jgi:hypothetical protein
LETKRCNCCNQDKLLSDFGQVYDAKDGHRGDCKKCRNAKIREHRREDPEPFRLAARRNYQKNHQSILERARKHHQKIRDEDNARRRQWDQDHPERVREHTEGLRSRFRVLMRGAAERNLLWTITLAEVEELPLICYYTGLELTLEHNQPTTFSLDRLDPLRGYEIGNIVSCCKIINYMKSKKDEAGFIRYCREVAEGKIQQQKHKKLSREDHLDLCRLVVEHLTS